MTQYVEYVFDAAAWYAQFGSASGNPILRSEKGDVALSAYEVVMVERFDSKRRLLDRLCCVFPFRGGMRGSIAVGHLLTYDDKPTSYMIRLG